MQLTLFTTKEECEILIKVQISHMTIFGKNKISLHFGSKDEQLKLIECLIKNYVIFECQGNKIDLIPETNNYQRVWYRFDS